MEERKKNAKSEIMACKDACKSIGITKEVSKTNIKESVWRDAEKVISNATELKKERKSNEKKTT